MNINVGWSSIKDFSTSREKPIQWVDVDDRYYLTCVDGVFTISCCLDKNNVEDAADFEENYKDDVALRRVEKSGIL